MGRKAKSEPVKKTTFLDFLITLGSGFVNLLKIEKIICLIFLYLIGRDIYFVVNVGKSDYYNGYIMDYRLFLSLLENDSTVTILLVVIICLIVMLVFFIAVVRFIYVTEIKRLSEERSRLMHDIVLGTYEPLKEHNTSEKI